MRIFITKPAQKQLDKLPHGTRKKVYRQFATFRENPRHPSLQVKKMVNSPYHEGRIDIHYRFRFLWQDDDIYIVSVGMHDTGLGKK